MRRGSLSTVCEEARCPNRTECFERKTATFLIAGDVCTRACGFCHITSGRPAPLDPEEPRRLVDAANEMGIRHIVVTSVDRDDLDDGGSAHWAAVVRALKEDDAARTVEVLTPDFQGAADAIDRVADAGPDVYNHNVETVPRLYDTVRPKSAFRRSVDLLGRVKARHPAMTTKSGLMLGLGEERRRGRGSLSRAARRGRRRRHGGAVPAAVRVEPARRGIRDARALRAARGAGNGARLFGRLLGPVRPLELPGGRVRAEERLTRRSRERRPSHARPITF